MEMFNAYIVPVVLIICLCIGYIIKHLVPTDRVNKFIPLIVGVLGVFISVWNSEWTVTPEILVIGLVSGLASTGLHQALKQFIDKGIDKEK